MLGLWQLVRRAFGGCCSKLDCCPGGKASRRVRGPAPSNRCKAASTLAYRCFLHQPLWDLLLLVQRSGWLQSFDRALGSAGVDEGSRHRTDSATRQGEVSGGQTADDFRQRAAVHRSRLQGVHSHLGDDARAYLALLSAVEWQDRTLAKSLKSECIRPSRR